jgi:hypothetical protein
VTSDFKHAVRASRRTSSLVVEAGRLCAVIERGREDTGLMLQMATMIRDGALEYERVVAVLRQVRTANSVEQARQLADDCLREI